jgi:non-heme chloroperoxidase
MPYLTVDKDKLNDIHLYYEDHGTGKPVVLIHGWPLSGRSWEKQVTALLAAGHRVITYDRRGFGQSSQPTFGYDYDTLTDDLHKLLLHLDIHDATLIGFSMGGGEVARYFGRFGADRVAKAAFISAIPPFLLKTDHNPLGQEASHFEETQKALLVDRPAFLAGFFQKFYNFDLLGGTLISESAVQASWLVAVGASPQGSHDCVTAWQDDFREDLSNITVPTLVVHGDADRILPIAVTGKRTHERVKGSRYVVIPGAPHGLNWTHAEHLNLELLAFMKT